MTKLNYITDTTDTDEITIKDASFEWHEELWGEGKSLTGKERNNHRGYKAVLQLTFEYDEQLLSVSEKIFNTLDAGGVVQYEDDGIIPMVPDNFEYTDSYKTQIKTKPSTLTLIGNVQKDRVFYITGVLCGSEDETCGQQNILCGI